MFLPPAGSAAETEDFFDIASNHGLIMDEGPRMEQSKLVGRPDPTVLRRDVQRRRLRQTHQRVAAVHHVRRADAQDDVFNCLIGLAAGERYTYHTSPGDFAFGPLPKFLTRFSAFVWDDTARIAKADQVVSVKAAKGPTPWFDRSTWLRKLPDGREQLLVNLINPPGYQGFCDRVQSPPTTLTNVSVSVTVAAERRELILRDARLAGSGRRNRNARNRTANRRGDAAARAQLEHRRLRIAIRNL